MAKSKYTVALAEQCRTLYESGLSLLEVSRRVAVESTAVTRYIRRSGGRIRPNGIPGNFTMEQGRWFSNLREIGMQTTDIARRANISTTTVDRYILKFRTLQCLKD